jgi:hypothetical protein
MRIDRRHAVLLAAVAIAGCGTVSSSGETTTRGAAASLGQPIATVSAPAPIPGAAPSAAPTAATSTSGSAAPAPESIRLPPPPHPAAPRSRAILRVATRFARAYLLYQIGREPRAVRQAIRSTCTPSFARLLLAQPVNVPSGQRSAIAAAESALGGVTYTGPASLGPGPPVQIVVARYHAIADPTRTGQLIIELTAAGGGWLVSSLR